MTAIKHEASVRFSRFRKRPTSGPSFDWQVYEDETSWQAATRHTVPAFLPSVRPTARPLRRVIWALLLIAALGIGVWTWQRAAQEVAVVTVELDQAVEAELWRDELAQPSLPETPAAAAIGSRSAVPAALRVPAAQVELLDLGQDWALVQVVITSTDAPVAYRQTQAYRAIRGEWRHTPPSPAMWGASQHLESEYFVFDYYARDEAAVVAAAAKLDALYPALWGAFSVMPPTGKHTFVVEPSVMPGTFIWGAKRPSDHTLASPAAYLAPVEMAEGDLLTQAAFLVVLNDLNTQWSAEHAWVAPRLVLGN